MDAASLATLSTIRQRGVASVDDVVRDHGLAETVVRQALAELARYGHVVNAGLRGYRLPDGRPERGGE